MIAVFKRADWAFWTEVTDRATTAAVPVLLLERWARGAGMRTWYLLESPSDVVAARRLVRPGARLTAYFAIRFATSGAAECDLLTRAEGLLADLGPNDQLLVLTRATDEPLLDVDYVTSRDELSGSLERGFNGDVWICGCPDWLSDGEEALTGVVPDDDGVVRDHPY